MSQIKTADVTTFMKDMVDMTMIYTVDDDGYVVRKSDGEQITINDGGVQSPLLIYQETIKDQSALIVNPMAEGLGSTPSSLWFYNTQKTALLGRIFTVFIMVLKFAMEEKKAKKDGAGHIPTELLSIAAKIIDDIDDKVLNEFMPLTEGKENSDFITIYYQRKQLRSVLRCALFETEHSDIQPWRSKFPKVRQKTWKIFETLMLAVLGIKDPDDMSKFTKKADEISCARLSSFLNVLLSVYREINPILDVINSDLAIDLSKLVNHINNLSAYTDNAKFMVQPSKGSTAPAPNNYQLPGTHSNIPIPAQAYGNIPTPAVHPGVTLIPGPAFADGRVSPPVPVMSGGGFAPVPQSIPYGNAYGTPQPYYGQQPMQTGYQPGYNDVPFAGPYIPAAGYPPAGGVFGGGPIQILPPGAPGGFNPNYR